MFKDPMNTRTCAPAERHVSGNATRKAWIRFRSAGARKDLFETAVYKHLRPYWTRNWSETSSLARRVSK